MPELLTKKKVVGVRRVASYPEDLNEVVKLPTLRSNVRSISVPTSPSNSPMNVTDDSDGRRNVDDVGFAHEKLLCLLANLA